MELGGELSIANPDGQRLQDALTGTEPRIVRVSGALDVGSRGNVFINTQGARRSSTAPGSCPPISIRSKIRTPSKR
jgi:hypothetical protein